MGLEKPLKKWGLKRRETGTWSEGRGDLGGNPKGSKIGPQRERPCKAGNPNHFHSRSLGNENRGMAVSQQ